VVKSLQPSAWCKLTYLETVFQQAKDQIIRQGRDLKSLAKQKIGRRGVKLREKEMHFAPKK